LYDGGKFQEEYNGNRKLEDLKSFLAKYAREPPKEETAAVILQEEVEDPLPKLNLKGEVLPIRDHSTFTATLEKGPTFIKFFAPWCGHCQKLAPTWVQLAAHLKDKVTVAEVDCDASSSLCAMQKIQGYPTLIYFSNGVRSEYTGGRSLWNLKTFAEKASQGRLHILHQDSELDKYVAENDVVYLFLYSPNDTGVLVRFLFPQQYCYARISDSDPCRKQHAKLLQLSSALLQSTPHPPQSYSPASSYPVQSLGLS
jgi:thioredoxin domain-containing protein 5